jgi:hypothetical protein
MPRALVLGSLLRCAALTVVGLLACSQVVLFQKLQTLRGPHPVASPVFVTNPFNERTRPVDSTGERHAVEFSSDRPPIPVEETLHRLPDGESLAVATTAEEIETVALNDESFCVPWEVNSDEWWTHHVVWEIFHEDDTHYCFRRLGDAAKEALLWQIYHNQFESDCSVMVHKKMWNSGISNDFRNVVDGLMHATQTAQQAFQVANMPWHYASPKPFNVTTAACPSQDMFCYFLPLSNCPRIPVDDALKKIGFFDRGAVLGPRLFIQPARTYLDYIRRPQTWLRRRLYDFVQAQSQVVAPCTALHVRRGDIVTHGTHSRRYYAIADYLNTSERIEPNVFLLTDDHNAIGEALHEFPDRNWMYINRPRYHGSEGGFERHLPSNDPILEMTVLLGTFRLVRRCTSMVRSSSAFGDFLWGEIKDEHVGEDFWFKRVDEHVRGVYSVDNIASANISKTYESH